MLKVIKKVLKWSAVGGALGAAYGLGAMNATSYTRYNKQPKKRLFRKGR